MKGARTIGIRLQIAQSGLAQLFLDELDNHLGSPLEEHWPDFADDAWLYALVHARVSQHVANAMLSVMQHLSGTKCHYRHQQGSQKHAEYDCHEFVLPRRSEFVILPSAWFLDSLICAAVRGRCVISCT